MAKTAVEIENHNRWLAEAWAMMSVSAESIETPQRAEVHLSPEGCKAILEEVEELRAAQRVLDALEAGGVDNWDWYSESLKNAEIDHEGNSLRCPTCRSLGFEPKKGRCQFCLGNAGASL